MNGTRKWWFPKGIWKFQVPIFRWTSRYTSGRVTQQRKRLPLFIGSNDQNPRYGLYIDRICYPVILGIIISHSKDPSISQTSISVECHSRVLLNVGWCLCQMLVKRKNPCVVRHVWDFYPEERSELLRTVERHADALAKLGILKGHHKGWNFHDLQGWFPSQNKMNGEVIQVYSSLGMSNILNAEGIGLKLFNLDSHMGWCDTDLGSKFPKDKLFKGILFEEVLFFVGIHLYLPWQLAWGWADDRRRFRRFQERDRKRRVKQRWEKGLGGANCHTLEGSGNVPMAKVGW